MQSRRHSFYESIATTAFGVCYSIPINYVIITSKWPDPWTQSVAMTSLFVILSITVKYVFRRWFNGWTTKLMRLMNEEATTTTRFAERSDDSARVLDARKTERDSSK